MKWNVSSIAARVTRRFENKNLPNFSERSPKSFRAKKGQNIYNKDQLESQKHLHKTNLKIPTTNQVLKLFTYVKM
jgi:hypothetical protein